jgi:hypothetical protein
MNRQSADPSMQPQPLRQRSVTSFNWWMVIFIGFVGIGCVSYMAWNVVWKVREMRVYHDECNRIGKVIKSLKGHRPATVSKKVWNNGIGFTVTAHYNVCFSPGHTDLAAMVRFGEKLDEKLQERVDLSIFEWIWDRLAETGPHGKRYTDQFRSSLREDLKARGTGDAARVVLPEARRTHEMG